MIKELDRIKSAETGRQDVFIAANVDSYRSLRIYMYEKYIQKRERLGTHSSSEILGPESIANRAQPASTAMPQIARHSLLHGRLGDTGICRVEH
jgi:hypothetical protein